jgi:exopolysaccharide production protein ExoQ
MNGSAIAPAARTQPYLLLGDAFIVSAVVATFGVTEVPTIGMLAIGAMGVAAAALAPRGAVRHVHVNLPLLLLMTWLVCTVAWTTNFTQTKTDILRMVPIVVGAALVGSLVPFERTVRTLKLCIVGIVAFTFLVVLVSAESRELVLPDGGVLPGWRGPFEHKNGIGPFVAFGVATFATFERRTAHRLVPIAAMVLLAVGAQSATAVTVLVAILGAWIWLERYRRQTERMSGSFVAVSVIAGAVLLVGLIVLLPAIVGLYGKDLTFTGRTDIWSASIATIKERPLAGYGLGGVWFDPSIEPTPTLRHRIGFDAGHAHNAVIELVLQAGLVGLALYGALLASVGGTAWRALRDRPRLAQWVLLMIVAQIVVGVSEVTLFHGWIFLLALAPSVMARRDPWTFEPGAGDATAHRARRPVRPERAVRGAGTLEHTP